MRNIRSQIVKFWRDWYSVQSANAGDQQALANLRHVLDKFPTVWRNVGDLGRGAESALIKLISNGNCLVQESLRHKADEMRRQLCGPAPSPLEELCVQRLVACYLEVEFTNTLFPEPKGDLKQAKFTLARKESSERRFNAALKSLALVRKMLPAGPPAVTRKPKKLRRKKKMNGAAKAAVANRVTEFVRS